MNKTLDEIKDIRALIYEHYDECNKERAKSRDVFIRYCNHIEKELKVLDIIKRHPFILERLFNESDKHDDYVHDYWWGVVTDKEVEMIKEWLDNE